MSVIQLREDVTDVESALQTLSMIKVDIEREITTQGFKISLQQVKSLHVNNFADFRPQEHIKQDQIRDVLVRSQR